MMLSGWRAFVFLGVFFSVAYFVSTNDLPGWLIPLAAVATGAALKATTPKEPTPTSRVR